MNWDIFYDYAAALCVIAAGLLSLAASIGMLRFTDTLSRLHAATKPQILGLLLIILAAALYQRSLMTLFIMLPVFVLQSLTAPVSAHMAGRAAYRADHVDRDSIVIDELEPVIKSINSGVSDEQRTEISAEESAAIQGSSGEGKSDVH